MVTSLVYNQARGMTSDLLAPALQELLFGGEKHCRPGRAGGRCGEGRHRRSASAGSWMVGSWHGWR
jgi:hypothetical protein